MIWFLAICLALIIAPGAAMATGLEAALIGFLTPAFGAAAAAAIGTFVTRVAFGAALSLVGSLFQKKPKVNPSGIQTEQTTSGDVTPQKFVVGTYSVEGHAVAPAYSTLNDNKLMTYILEISNVPVTGLTGRVSVDGQWRTITDVVGYNLPALAGFIGAFDLGFVLDDFPTQNRAWIKFYDGTQTTADPGLVSRYGSHPDRPWTADHILHGTAYAAMHFWFDQAIYSGLPSVRFEVLGIPLYDPRKDTTVGGSGSHRWANPSTWEWTDNPQVINYNILRGITLPTGDVWGGRVPAEDLPLDNWFAAMNECDVLIGSRKQYVAGFEINVQEHEPLDVIEEMNRASFAQISEFGGVFRVRVGAPAAPVLSLTDADFVITEPALLTPFPTLEEIANGITGTYLEPNDLWEGRDADGIFNTGWENEDGGQRIINVGLPAVSDKSQAQHLLNSYLLDGRRFITHRMTLPPSFATIEPLDSISFTSDIYGYSAKVFEVVEVEDRPDTLMQVVTVREREAGDVAWAPELDVPAPLPTNGLTPPAPLVVPLSATAFELSDASSTARRPAILLAWDPDFATVVRTLKFQVRVKATGEVVAEGVKDVIGGRALVRGDILPATEYEARARYQIDVPTAWTPWLSVTTPDLRLIVADFSTGIEPITIISSGSLPTVKSTETIVFQSKLYRWNGTAYIATIPAGDMTGQLTNAQIADLAAAKLTGQIQTPQIATSAVTDAKIAGMAASKVSGQLTNAQISDLAAAKLTGQITGTQITDSAITTPKLSAGAVTASQIAASAVTVDKLAANSVTAAKIAAGTITTAEIAAGTIQASNIATDTITASQIAASAITASEIATGAVTAVKVSASAITADKIAASAVTVDKLAANAITAAKIAADAVTADKVAANAITTAKIAAGAVQAAQIDAGAITASKLTVGDFTNLIPDAGLYDASSWNLGSGFSLSDSDGVFETTDRRLIWSGSPASGSANGFVAAGDSDFFVVDATREYVVGGMFRSNTSGMSGTAQTRIHWFDVDQVLIADHLVHEHTLVNSQQKYSAIMTPPAGAVFAKFRARRGRDASGDVSGPTLWYHSFVRPATSSEVIVNGTVQANHIDTVSFAAAGLAVFGGGVQSDDFVTGVSGWMVDESGDAEFNSLIVRSSLVDGAVSDGSAVYAGTGSLYYHGTVPLLISIPGSELTGDSVFTLAYGLEIRSPGDYDEGVGVFQNRTSVLFQYRLKTGTVWGGWVSLPGTGLVGGDVWLPRDEVQQFVFNADGLEVRLVVQLEESNQATYINEQNNLRKIGLSARAVKR